MKRPGSAGEVGPALLPLTPRRCWPRSSSVRTTASAASASTARFSRSRRTRSTATTSPICREVRRSSAASGNAACSPGSTACESCFHPDQFVVLNSLRPVVVQASLREIEYQAEVAEWVGADVINIHGGGGFGDKPRALADFARNLARISPRARSRLTRGKRRQNLHARRPVAPVPGRGPPAGVRRASSSLQPR